MDSSSHSPSHTVEVESPRLDEVENISSDDEAEGSLLTGLVSRNGNRDIEEWRRKYALPQELIFRIPGPSDRISDFGVDEVSIYEAYFEAGFWGRVPSLISKLSEYLVISPGHLTPPAWKTLIAIQNLGDLEGLMLGVNEVLYSYYVTPLSGSKGKYYLHPRGGNALVKEIEKGGRKRHSSFSGRWAEIFYFINSSRLFSKLACSG